MTVSTILFFLIVLCGVHFCRAQDNQINGRTKFSPREVKEDFKYLYKTLEQTHYNLYVVTKKETFEKQFQKNYNSITDSLNVLEITRLFQPFAALSSLAHCNISFPRSEERRVGKECRSGWSP